MKLKQIGTSLNNLSRDDKLLWSFAYRQEANKKFINKQYEESLEMYLQVKK